MTDRWRHVRLGLAAWVRRLFKVATIEDRTGVHYHVTWLEGDAVATRRWRWWNPRDLPWCRPRRYR